jgi:catechol 2,3-dioxygenase-like lactoylglutathione lyase family enzyme
MLGNTDVAANLAVKNLDVARKFYQDILGLKVIGNEGEELLAFKSGNARLNVYRSEFAGTNKATAATWEVGPAIEDVVQSLKNKGVKFEHYDNLPGLKVQGDLHVGGGAKLAWFKDPDGNILNVFGR